MAMTSRSPRSRGGSARWLVIPLVLTLAVLLVDAAMHARSKQPQSRLDSEAWVDRALPDIAQSSAQGREIAEISSTPLDGASPAVAAELSQIALAATSTYKAVLADAAPPGVTSSAGLLQACLAARKSGAAQMASAVQNLLAGAAASSSVSQMMSAVSDFRVGDSAYQLFAKDLPKLGITMPASVWAGASAGYDPTELDAFASKLLAGSVNAPIHQLAIDAITTNPPALRVEDNVQILSPGGTVSVTAVVDDRGQSPESRVDVTATIAPAAGAPSQQVSTAVSLSPGQAYAVQLAGLRIMQSAPTELTIGAVEPGGEPGSAYKSIMIDVPGPGFTGVTTLPPTTNACQTSGSITSTTSTTGVTTTTSVASSTSGTTSTSSTCVTGGTGSTSTALAVTTTSGG
jgi:hypothetical protein